VADGSQVARWREVSPAWRARLAEVTAAEPTDLSWRQLGILDSLLLGEEEAALERVRLAVDDGLGRNQVAAAALIAWQSGQEATASRIWTANQTLPVNGGVEDCFPQAVAQALIARDPAAGALLAAIESNSPEFFAPALPSHTRCGFAALAWASLGDAGRAVGWWRRALVEDPVAAARTAAWIRACRQGGVES